MKDAIMIAVVLCLFGFGYFLMTNLDKFLIRNKKAIEKENEIKIPSCIILTEEMSQDEILEEIRRFRESHERTQMIIFDGSDTPDFLFKKEFVDRKR